ncbi:proline-rich protein 18-like isoform X1 [Sus scrofa]|uniref:proline-rich protein 18-like isoform X1 n=1 Tax=Sus scrofa TaxID=9823 RepID=UPI000A2B2F47|nr:proline-rich protein 18-like isoform X1 [Sus scrofa]
MPLLLPPPPPPPPGLLPLLLPRVRLLPPLLCAPDPAAAQARASSSLPKICNLRAGPAHAAARHRYRSNLTPAAGLTPPPLQTPPPQARGRAGCGRSGLPAGGRRGLGRACPSPERRRLRHCGARRLAGQRGLGGPAALASLLLPPCVTRLLWRARKVRSGCGDVRRTGPPNLRGPGTETTRWSISTSVSNNRSTASLRQKPEHRLQGPEEEEEEERVMLKF